MSEPLENARSGISRRAFLKGGSVAAAATALGTAPPQLLADDPPSAQPAGNIVAVGPGPVQIELTVNGMKMTTKVEPRVTLLDALRNHLDVTGCKRVCDRGTCGSCTVMIDGHTVYACSMLALEARGKDIRTAESLNADGKLDAVPAAFAKFDAQQCGFCTPGFVVSLRAALDKNPKATPAELEHAVSGNICRCGTYEQMRHAIASLCEQKKGG
ncbi:MAG TPA: (2Fe-2S)-binding protein [Gemmataceae bacterium]|nr:(2Fe-2S)-binding protein [Gemmataceae bacterium]